MDDIKIVETIVKVGALEFKLEDNSYRGTFTDDGFTFEKYTVFPAGDGWRVEVEISKIYLLADANDVCQDVAFATRDEALLAAHAAVKSTECDKHGQTVVRIGNRVCAFVYLG